MISIETKSGGSCRYELQGDSLKLSFPGSNSAKDVWHDILALGGRYVAGVKVALGVAIQTEEIFHELIQQVGLNTLMAVREVNISGHSLGAGNGMVMPLFFYEQFGKNKMFNLSFDGPLYSLSKKAVIKVEELCSVIVCREFHRDVVPQLSALRWSRVGFTRKGGPKGVWDFDIISGWHQRYWDKAEDGKSKWFS